MAFTCNETDFRIIEGEAGVARLIGNCVLTGVTSGVIQPGANTVNYLAPGGGTPTKGMHVILCWSFTNNLNTNAFKVVKSYTSGVGDALTITGTLGDSFDFVIWGNTTGNS
jgi:hypothetical protein